LEAKELFTQAFKLFKAFLGDEYPIIPNVIANLVGKQRNVDRWATAEELLVEYGAVQEDPRRRTSRDASYYVFVSLNL
jgi:hypothetical protein